MHPLIAALRAELSAMLRGATTSGARVMFDQKATLKSPIAPQLAASGYDLAYAVLVTALADLVSNEPATCCRTRPAQADRVSTLIADEGPAPIAGLAKRLIDRTQCSLRTARNAVADARRRGLVSELDGVLHLKHAPAEATDCLAAWWFADGAVPGGVSLANIASWFVTDVETIREVAAEAVAARNELLARREAA